MPIATLVDIIEHTGLEADVAAKVERRLSVASQRVKKLIGETYYDELEAITDTSDDQYDERQRVVEAECLLAYAEAIPVEVNTRMSEKGGLVQSIGYGETRQGLMGNSGMEFRQKHLRNQAKILLGDLILASNGVWVL